MEQESVEGRGLGGPDGYLRRSWSFAEEGVCVDIIDAPEA
jgi:hypothetical protein